QGTLPKASIVTVYAGNELRVALGSAHGTSAGSLVVNWYGQLIARPLWELPGGVHAYYAVRTGRPLTPRAPAREGLVADAALDALTARIADLARADLAARRPPSVDELRLLTRLCEGDVARTQALSPYAITIAVSPIDGEIESVADVAHDEHAADRA